MYFEKRNNRYLSSVTINFRRSQKRDAYWTIHFSAFQLLKKNILRLLRSISVVLTPSKIISKIKSSVVLQLFRYFGGGEVFLNYQITIFNYQEELFK